MIEVFALPEAEIGTTARFVICWHEHADPIRCLMLVAKRKTSARSEYFAF
jgi:hypothetical protein